MFIIDNLLRKEINQNDDVFAYFDIVKVLWDYNDTLKYLRDITATLIGNLI